MLVHKTEHQASLVRATYPPAPTSAFTVLTLTNLACLLWPEKLLSLLKSQVSLFATFPRLPGLLQVNRITD